MLYFESENEIKFYNLEARYEQKPPINANVDVSSWAKSLKGAQWLSGRVLDSRPKGRGFEPHRRHCVVVLE